jgi:hypothetical protein
VSTLKAGAQLNCVTRPVSTWLLAPVLQVSTATFPTLCVLTDCVTALETEGRMAWFN